MLVRCTWPVHWRLLYPPTRVPALSLSLSGPFPTAAVFLSLFTLFFALCTDKMHHTLITTFHTLSYTTDTDVHTSYFCTIWVNKFLLFELGPSVAISLRLLRLEAGRNKGAPERVSSRVNWLHKWKICCR